jgi:hypothetical protein
LPQVVVFDSKVVVNRIIGVGDPVVQSSFCNSNQINIRHQCLKFTRFVS